MFCQKCSDKPELVPPGKPHQNSAGVILPTKVFCRGCGYNYGAPAKVNFSQMWRCTKCMDYYVCTNCKMCHEGHFLFKCYSLRLKGTPGGFYQQNMFNCDVCHKDCMIGPNHFPYVYHCNPCEYDVCLKHYFDPKKTFERAIKEEKKVKKPDEVLVNPSVTEVQGYPSIITEHMYSSSSSKPQKLVASAPLAQHLHMEEDFDEQFSYEGGLFD